MDLVVKAAGTSHTPIYLTTQHSLLQTPHRPTHHTKGTLLTALIIFQHDPINFLHQLANNTKWNPSYVVLFCLNPNVNTTTVLFQPVVQRSHFILLLQPIITRVQSQHQQGRQRLVAYTSRPPHVHTDTHEGSSRLIKEPLTHTVTDTDTDTHEGLIKVPLGVWDPQKFTSRRELFPPRYDNFGDSVIDVTIQCYDQPFLYLLHDQYAPVNDCMGINIDTLEILAHKLRFKFTLYTPKEVVWGYKKDGIWYGNMAEMMYRGKHLNINVMQPSPDRASDFDYIYPYWDTSFAFLLPNPPPLPRWRNVYYPFSTLSWVLLLLSTLTVSILVSLLLHYVHGVPDPVGVGFKVACGLLSQASPMLGDLQIPWARVLLLIWWLVVDVVASIYTGNLVAVLSVPAYPNSIHTVKELVASNIKPGMVDYGSFVPQALRDSENPLLATLGQRLYLDTDVKLVGPYDAMIEKVFEKTHSLLVVYDYLRVVRTKTNITKTTYMMKETVFKSYMTWFLLRNTPYTHTFSFYVRRLLETGVMAKLYKNHVGVLIEDGGKVKLRINGVLNLDHLQGAFILLGLGVTVAVMVFLRERLSYTRSHSHSSHSLKKS
ncbi:hypothetical protein Pmani_001000 [Petrolisthes manimaculis]|uniref:Uncharacterized protein n=1 Tax=Petrolisthes manimaculis TaxID=1843537 RepID=A0AAE1QL80_9EUCA|nr:hypothetical protein Pmani_001000 [Petrolisthes manimaculis]